MRKQSLLILFMVLCVVPALIFWSRTLTAGAPLPVYLYDIGRLLALVVFLFILFQYVLISKIKWIEKGLGLDRLLTLHKTLGLLLIIALPLHPVLLLLSERL